ncbi:MAG: alpha/beta hydrolase family protein [Flavobacteriales bacterium]
MKRSNLIYIGSQGKKSCYDLIIPECFNGTIIYFIHGYKGYKDWGTWNIIADYFANHGFGFAKCNLSHNGTTLENPTVFDDLEAFGRNTYSNDINDISLFIDAVETALDPKIKINKRVLIGHSRGGGCSILSAEKSNNIDVLVTWASISNIETRFPKGEQLKLWKTSGVYHIINGRTKQKMPHYYSFYEDFLNNKNILNIEKASKRIEIPWAIFHGTNDDAVKTTEAQMLNKWASNSDLFLIKDANHVFGGKEPFLSSHLPDHTLQLVKETKAFIELHH